MVRKDTEMPLMGGGELWNTPPIICQRGSSGEKVLLNEKT